MSSEPIYSLRVSDVYQTLETSPAGLSDAEVAERRSLYGDNRLAEPPPPPRWRMLLRYITYPLALILWGAGALAFVVSQPALGVVIWVIILVNAGFTFWSEYRAQQAMQSLRQILPDYARLARAGAEAQVPADQLVPGDVLILEEGDNIPADARVVEEYGLRVNNATLTGEAVPARKTADASLRDGISELERPNLVFAGTSVVSGTGRAVIYATGMLTQFGRIAQLSQVVVEEPSQLQREMARITRRLSLVALGIGGIVFVVGIFDVGLGTFESFLLALGILVATVPEGLPATVTLSLAMAAQRLAKRGVLVKKLAMLETLGSVSIICTDKSGTLTQNQMTVREVWIAGQRLTVSGSGYNPDGSFTPDLTGTSLESNLNALLIAATQCNNSRLYPPSAEHRYWTCLGDQTEAALRVAALKGGIHDQDLEESQPRIHELPFDARRKRMTTIHQLEDAVAWMPGAPDSFEEIVGEFGTASDFTPDPFAFMQEIAYIKGAPREVLQLCTHILMDGEERLLDESLRNQVLAANDDYARGALRVLALARRKLPYHSGLYSPESVERDLTFLGLMAMMDPPRPEVARAMDTLHQAGIRMVMITGDYGLTAESLARRVGMLTTPNPSIVTGAEFEAMNDIELQGLLEKEIIYARMAPDHKLRLVAAYQARGDVVAVTGDGVNDAPALRKADVAVAMGMVGTDVAKEAADVILTDDNFSDFVSAIEEGRAIYDNLRKFITYIFSSNVPEVLPFILTALFDIPLALLVIQILAIDLGTDLLPALALGTEKPEPDVMRRPPRRRNQPLLDRHLIMRSFLWLGMIEALLCYTGFFLVYVMAGAITPGFLPPSLLELLPDLSVDPASLYLLAVTTFHAGVVMSQVGNAFACRTEKARGRHLGWLSNRFLLVGVFVEILIILILIYFPPLAEIFNHVPMPSYFWIGLALYPFVLYSLDWIRKGIVRRMQREERLTFTGGSAP